MSSIQFALFNGLQLLHNRSFNEKTAIMNEKIKKNIYRLCNNIVGNSKKNEEK